MVRESGTPSTRETNNTVVAPTQRTSTSNKGYAADLPPYTVFGPPMARYGSSDESQVITTRAIPTRTQSAVPQAEADLEPTAETYVPLNPTVPYFIKHNPRRAMYLERNAFCRYIGGIGPYYGHKRRYWLMGASACVTFTCLLLLVVPLISMTTTSQLLYMFNWAYGECHWKLMQPVDWTETMYLGLGGMANKTHRTPVYYVKYDSKECRELAPDMCKSCNAASILTLIFICISIAAALLGLLLDIHRFFKYFDLNFSKALALFTHLLVGIPCAILSFLLFITMCYLAIPFQAVHQGYGKQGVGLYLFFKLGPVAWCTIAMAVLRPIPGILHLIVPTPSWANDKGIKAMRNRKAGQTATLDAFDGIVNEMMRNPIEEKVDKDPAFAIPIRTQSNGAAIAAPTVVDRSNRKESDAASVESDHRHYGELVSKVGDAPGLETIPVTLPADDVAELDLPAAGIPASPGPDGEAATKEEPDGEVRTSVG